MFALHCFQTWSCCRYNNFQHDPLSRCNCTPPYSGENAISARSDLNPPDGKYPFGALGHRYHGGTDNKVQLYFHLSLWMCVCLCVQGLYWEKCAPTYIHPSLWSDRFTGEPPNSGHRLDNFSFIMEGLSSLWMLNNMIREGTSECFIYTEVCLSIHYKRFYSMHVRLQYTMYTSLMTQTSLTWGQTLSHYFTNLVGGDSCLLNHDSLFLSGHQLSADGGWE